MAKACHILVVAMSCAFALGQSEEGCAVDGTCGTVMEEQDGALSLLQAGARVVKAARLTANSTSNSTSTAVAKHAAAPDTLEKMRLQPHVSSKLAQALMLDDVAQALMDTNRDAWKPPRRFEPERFESAAVRFVSKFTPGHYHWGYTELMWFGVATVIFLIIYEALISWGFHFGDAYSHLWSFLDESVSENHPGQIAAGQWQYYSYGFYQYAVFGVCVPLSEPLAAELGYNAAWSGLLMTIMPFMEVPGIEIGRRVAKSPWHQNYVSVFLLWSRMGMCFSQVMWVWALLSPSFRNSPQALWWTIFASRALLGTFSGMSNTPTTLMAVQWTQTKRGMTAMTSYATMAKRLGMSVGCGMSSLVLEVLNMKTTNSTLYQMAAMPVAACAVGGFLLNIGFTMTMTRKEPPASTIGVAAAKSQAGAAPGQVPVLTDHQEAKQKSIVLNGLIFNFTGSMVRESIDLASTMIFTSYGLGFGIIGYLIAAINFSSVIWIQLVTQHMKEGGWFDPRYLIVNYSIVCCICGLFFFHFGPWWLFLAADCICFTATTAGIGIANGVATNNGIPGTWYSKENFTAQRAQMTAAARFLAGPVSRGAVAWTGQTGYALIMFLFLGTSMYNMAMVKYQMVYNILPEDEKQKA